MQILTSCAMETIIFEVLPPPITWEKEKVNLYCNEIVLWLQKQKILFVGIPEIVKETRNGNSAIPYTPKLDNVTFAMLLRERCPLLVPLLYKITVRLNQAEFKSWVHDIHTKGFRHVILVGGESKDFAYPGYTVLEACRYIKQHYPQIQVGGITIFTRHGEVARIKEKMDAGMDYFFSQILFEATNMKLIILNLLRSCRAAGCPLPMIYISLAQASTLKGIQFMQWLGVEFPSAVLYYLTEEGEVATNCSDIMQILLDEIFYFIGKEEVPLGFNIEHVMYDNFTLSQQLFKDIKERIPIK